MPKPSIQRHYKIIGFDANRWYKRADLNMEQMTWQVPYSDNVNLIGRRCMHSSMLKCTFKTLKRWWCWLYNECGASKVPKSNGEHRIWKYLGAVVVCTSSLNKWLLRPVLTTITSNHPEFRSDPQPKQCKQLWVHYLLFFLKKSAKKYFSMFYCKKYFSIFYFVFK